MHTQLESLKAILNEGSLSFDGRNGATISLYGTQHRYPAELGAPIPTTKRVNDRWVALELEWFLKGLTDNNWLLERGVSIWNKWDRELLDHDATLALLDTVVDPHSPHTTLKTKALNLTEYRNAPTEAVKLDVLHDLCNQHELKTTSGHLGPVYGEMFRAWPTRDGATIDQIRQLDDNLRKAPMSRRHVVSLWNPELLPDESKHHSENIAAGKQVLPPCHLVQQVMIEELTLTDIVSENGLSLAELLAMADPWLNGNDESLLTGQAESLLPTATPYQVARYIRRLTMDTSSKSIVTIIQDLASKRIDPVSYFHPSVTTVEDTLSFIMETDATVRDGLFGALKAAGYKTHKVHLQFYMRSNDEPVGRPFNVFSYYLLKEIIANVHNFVPGDLIQATGVAHIYLDQVDAVMEQLSRTPGELPKLKWHRHLESIVDFTADDYELVGYNPQAYIRTPVSE